jgi:DNA polymerase-4
MTTADDINWLFLDLNSFFASCEQQDNPALRGRPVAVVPSLADTTCVIAASYEAKAYGVKTGTLVRDARKLCPDIVFVTGQHRRYVQYHHRVIAAAEAVLPVEQILSVDEFATRLIGDERTAKGAMALAHKVKQSIRETVGECLTCSIGLAPSRMLAKVASNMQKPNGLTVLTGADIPEKILHLPLQAIPGIGPRMAPRLGRHSITTMADLYAANVHTLRAAWGGIEGERMHQKLRGIDPYYAPTQTRGMGHQHVLEPSFRNPEGLISYSQHLTLKLAERLRQRQFMARTMNIYVKWDRDYTKSYVDTSFHEANDSPTLLRILNERLLARLPKNKSPFKIAVGVGDIVPASAHQLDMFTDTSGADLSAALDKINTRYGRGTVFFGGTQALQSHLHARIAFQRVPGEDEFEDRLRKVAAIQSRMRDDSH